MTEHDRQVGGDRPDHRAENCCQSTGCKPLYVDMLLFEGRDLESMLTRGPLNPRRAVAIVGQLAKALHAAHKVGSVHRDVKPSNILLDEDDFAYLIDFCIARAINESGLTSTGTVNGTWHHMAPERLSGREADPRSDICTSVRAVRGFDRAWRWSGQLRDQGWRKTRPTVCQPQSSWLKRPTKRLRRRRPPRRLSTRRPTMRSGSLRRSLTLCCGGRCSYHDS